MTIKELLFYLNSFSDIEKEKELIIHVEPNGISEWVHLNIPQNHNVRVRTNCETPEYNICYFLDGINENDIKEREYHEQMKRELDI